jgi:four helix bundle protein
MKIQEQIKIRTKAIGLKVIDLVEKLPAKPASWILSKQIIRSSTAIGANYRAACRAKSTADFINKLKIVEEETDETIYWMEIMQESGLTSVDKTRELMSEATQILAIIVASIKTSRARYHAQLP